MSTFRGICLDGPLHGTEVESNTERSFDVTSGAGRYDWDEGVWVYREYEDIGPVMSAGAHEEGG